VHPESASGSGPDLVEALAARVDEIDAQLRATAAVIDEKSLKEFRRTVETLSKRDGKFEERLSNKVDVVADRLETFARTVSTTSAALAAKDGEIAQLRRELDSASARFDSGLAEVKRGLDPTALNEVKRAMLELSKQKLPRGLEDRIDELGAKLTMLAQRIDTVSSTVSTTASGLAGRDGDVIALRRAYEVDSERIGAELADVRRAMDPTPVAELRQAVSELRERSSEQWRSLRLPLDEAVTNVDALAGRLESIATSQSATIARVSASEEQVSTLRAHVEENGVHLNTLAGTVAAATERLDARDLELEALEHKFHAATMRVDNLVAELSRALTELPDPVSTEQALEAHLGEFDRVRTDDRARVEEVADRLEALFASFASMADRGPASEALERRIDELVERIDDAVDDRATTSSEVARLAAILEVERGAVRSRLESLAAAVESSTGTLTADEGERRVIGFDGRVAAAERDREALTTAVGQLAGAVDADRASFQTQLEALAAALSWTSPKSSIEDRLQGLDKRMGDLERRNAEVSSKVSQATTLLPTALRSLEARLDEVAPGTRAATVTEHVPPPQPAPRGRLERRPHDPDDEPAEDADPDRTPTAVVPFRGTDP
jgi:chromosome segregation ATPase